MPNQRLRLINKFQNNIIYNTLVVNQSKQNIRKFTLEFELDIKHSQQVEELENALKNSIQPYLSNITENSFSLKVMDIKKDLVHYKIQFLIPRPDKQIERQMRRLLNLTIIDMSGRKITEEVG